MVGGDDDAGLGRPVDDTLASILEDTTATVPVAVVTCPPVFATDVPSPLLPVSLGIPLSFVVSPFDVNATVHHHPSVARHEYAKKSPSNVAVAQYGLAEFVL